MIWPMRKFHVGRNQLGVLFDGGEFRGFLRPGTSWRLDPLQRWPVT